MMWRIIYSRVFFDKKEASRAAKEVSGFSPEVRESGRSVVIELGRFKTAIEAYAAYSGFRESGLRVFVQKIGG